MPYNKADVLISKDKFNVCQFCGKHFSRAELLAVHVEYEHEEEIGTES